MLPFPDNVLMSLVNTPSTNILSTTPPITITTATTPKNAVSSNLSELNKTSNSYESTKTNPPSLSIITSQIIKVNSFLILIKTLKFKIF